MYLFFVYLTVILSLQAVVAYVNMIMIIIIIIELSHANYDQLLSCIDT